MGSAAPLASPPSAPRRLQRHWGEGLGNLFRFLRGTGGLESAFDAMFALAGPTVEREFDRFARHPLGLRLLAERPRRDLNALLADREQLQAMPADSFAAAYLEYMGGAGMGTSDYFLAAANLEEKAARFGWTEDQCWFVRRMANSHDLFHVVSGYDRTILGEVGVDAFTAGHIPMLPLRLFLGYLLLLKPSAPFEWSGYVLRCYRQGRATPPLSCLDWESIFPLPVDEARRRAGVCNLAEIHPNGFPAPGKKLVRLENKLQGK